MPKLYTIKKVNKPQKLKNRSEQELKRIAHDIYTGKVFCNRQVDPCMLGSVFMVWALLNPLEKKEMLDRGMSMMYANMSAAMPRQINGYPVFGEMSILNKHDDLRVYKHYKDIQEAMGQYRGDFYYEQ